ncbi:MAG TPA: DUF1501 domain-containing protein [Saprospiraceae bacterium]|nr:DUF1501 domain-containing protein [Saprospiraceae bacterium]
MKHINSRRKFIKQFSCASVGYATMYSSLINLKAMAASSIFNTSTIDCGGYKALVCILLSGGNDSFNMLIPKGDNEYQEYLTTRSSSIAIPKSEILEISTSNQGGKILGIHPSLVNIKNLYDQGKVCFISNIGSLVEPITNKTDFYNDVYNVPLGLFSHADQIMHWQTSIPQMRSGIGWGGKVADLLGSCNSNQNISMNISLAGTNIFQTGNNTVEYAIDPYYGSKSIIGLGNPEWLVESVRSQALNSMIDTTYQDMFKKTFINTIKSSRDGQIQFDAALGNINPFSVTFSDNGLSKSFEMIAKTIAARNELEMSRQIFFIEYGGWDHHDEVLQSQETMFTELDNAMYEFNAALEELAITEQSNIQNEVVSFTMSEFARTLTSNGNGTDHAWGGNVLVLGGPVNGGQVHGTYPSLELDSPIEIGGGVLIPQFSIDEYFAELALWFGVSQSELVTIFPNINNFYSGTGNPINFLTI